MSDLNIALLNPIYHIRSRKNITVRVVKYVRVHDIRLLEVRNLFHVTNVTFAPLTSLKLKQAHKPTHSTPVPRKASQVQEVSLLDSMIFAC